MDDVIVVDASFAVDALVEPGQRGREAREVLAQHREEVAVPDLFDAEVVSGLRGRWLGGKLALGDFRAAFDDLIDLPLDRYRSCDLLDRAYQLRENVAPYDACYVHLAELLDVPLYTSDRRLSHAPGVRCEIRVLGDAA